MIAHAHRYVVPMPDGRALLPGRCASGEERLFQSHEPEAYSTGKTDYWKRGARGSAKVRKA